MSACIDTEDPAEINEGEVITTVALTFTPQGGGAPLAFRWADPENDGAPLIDEVVLPDAGDFDLTVSFLNELEAPPEDIGAEVAAEGEQHQVFLTGSAVQGPATPANPAAPLEHSYDDADADGFPVGIQNTIATTAGVGSLVVTLRHLPPDGAVVVKTGALAADLAERGFDGIPGDTDAQVTFPVRVE